MFTRITYNLNTAHKRHEWLDGKEYVVVPAVSMAEGVHEGNQGPLYYPAPELSRNPLTWNGKPVIVYHPQQNGQEISACDPLVIEKQGIGLMFNSGWDGRLKHEVWIDPVKANKVDPRIMGALNDDKMLEVSTGMFHDGDTVPGEHKGQKYVGTVRNIQPDHLAVLPDQLGAFSIAKGGGLLRNADGAVLSYENIRDQLRGLLREGRKNGLVEDFCYVCDVYPKYCIYECRDKYCKQGYKSKAGKIVLDGEPEEVRKVTHYVTANGQAQPLATNHYVTMNGQLVGNQDMQGPLKVIEPPREGDISDVMKHQQAQKALGEHYAGVAQEGSWGGWVVDLYANYAVYSKDGKLFRLPYTYDDDKIRFDGQEEEVERTSTYRIKQQAPIDGTSSPYSLNQDLTMSVQKPSDKQVQVIKGLADLAHKGQLTVNAIHQGAHHLLHEPDTTQHPHQEPASGKSDTQVRSTVGGARKHEVDSMIAGGHAQEADRGHLEGLADDHFESVKKFALKGATLPVQPYSYEGIGDRSNAPAKAAQNAQPQVAMNVQQFLQVAPPEIRSLLANGLAAAEREKGQLIQVITNAPGNRFNPDWLKTREVEELRGMAALAAGQGRSVAANYAGQADTPPMYLTLNSQDNQEGEMPALALPSILTAPPDARAS